MAVKWKKGRGKLGSLAPLLGAWTAVSESPMGRVRCSRTFSPVLGEKFLRMDGRWEIGDGGAERLYEEMAIIGTGDDGMVWFWSFTSDGKRSQGRLTDVSDLHPEAVGFEADMPAGKARMAYWPSEDEGFYWVVESQTKKGWKRFVEHLYQAA